MAVAEDAANRLISVIQVLSFKLISGPQFPYPALPKGWRRRGEAASAIESSRVPKKYAVKLACQEEVDKREKVLAGRGSTYILYARIFAYLEDLLVLRRFHSQIDRFGTFASLSHCRNKAKIRRFSPLLWSIPMTKHESTKSLDNVSVLKNTKEGSLVIMIRRAWTIFNNFGNSKFNYFLVDT